MDVAPTTRREDHKSPQVPRITDTGLVFATNCDNLRVALDGWSLHRTMDDIFELEFCKLDGRLDH